MTSILSISILVTNTTMLSQGKSVSQIMDETIANFKKNFTGEKCFESIFVSIGHNNDINNSGVDDKCRVYLSYLNLPSELEKVRVYCLTEFDTLIMREKIITDFPNHDITKYGQGYYKFTYNEKYSRKQILPDSKNFPMHWIEIIPKSLQKPKQDIVFQTVSVNSHGVDHKGNIYVNMRYVSLNDITGKVRLYSYSKSDISNLCKKITVTCTNLRIGKSGDAYYKSDGCRQGHVYWIKIINKSYDNWTEIRQDIIFHISKKLKQNDVNEKLVEENKALVKKNKCLKKLLRKTNKVLVEE